MTASCCDFEGAFDMFLSLDIGKIKFAHILLRHHCDRVRSDRCAVCDGVIEQRNAVEEAGHGVDFDITDDCSFGGVLERHHQLPLSIAAGFHGDGEDAGHGADATVESKLTDEQPLLD